MEKIYVKFNNLLVSMDKLQWMSKVKRPVIGRDKYEIVIRVDFEGDEEHLLFSTTNEELRDIVFEKITDGIIKGVSISFNFNYHIDISDDELSVLMNEIE